MKKFVLAPALAALVMFFWGFIYYGVSGIPYRALEDSSSLAAAVSALPADGTYLTPDPRGPEEAMAEAMKTGPFAMVHFRKIPEAMGPIMLKGYLHEFVCCLLVVVLLVRCQSSLDSFRCRLMFVSVIGILIALFSHGSAAIWWQQGWAWNLMMMLYDVVAWLLAGLVLAKLVAPKAA